ncbi:serine/threonine protein phosphatase [Halovulum dunhuangense]|uniref:Serine/threonine protein phosphatase n=1 Tax=Halovulum dunhuangense TaxID=1505036 RepID=A0A849KZJ6_9RHOB|nr:metallophosphoesterase [Halovulum dunhuangense]NNU79682.1 serine/threonine protein phosphatase [Halovulum dunhuangense]
MTRILAFSDLHLSRGRAEALVAASADADLVIGAGDFCNQREGLVGAMSMLKDMTRPFVMVPGNAESAGELREAAHQGMTVLHGEGVEIAGLAIFGLGYGIPETPFGAWSCDMGETDAAALLERCARADILVTHSPPKGAVDVTSQGRSVGSTAIRDAILRLRPRLAVCGHIHDSWGRSATIGATQVRNLGPTPNWFEV